MSYGIIIQNFPGYFTVLINMIGALGFFFIFSKRSLMICLCKLALHLGTLPFFPYFIKLVLQESESIRFHGKEKDR